MALAFENNIKENKNAFIQKVIQISNALRINPNWLMSVMMHESGLNHRITNFINCVGLIQFCPGGGLNQTGKTVAQMQAMSNVQQLDYVYNFFKPYASKIKSYYDLHLIAFYPYAFITGKNKNMSYIFGSEISLNNAKVIASQNKGFDYNKDGVITMQDFINYENAWLKSKGVSFEGTAQNNNDALLLPILLIGLIELL